MPIDEHLCSKHIISPNIYFVNSFFNFFIIVLNISDNALQVQPEKGHIIIQTRQSEFVPYIFPFHYYLLLILFPIAFQNRQFFRE